MVDSINTTQPSGEMNEIFIEKSGLRDVKGFVLKPPLAATEISQPLFKTVFKKCTPGFLNAIRIRA